MDRKSERLRRSFGQIAEYIALIESKDGKIHSISPVNDTFVHDDVLRVRVGIEIPQLAGLSSGEVTLAGEDLTVTEDGTPVLEFVVSVPPSDGVGNDRDGEEPPVDGARERSDRGDDTPGSERDPSDPAGGDDGTAIGTDDSTAADVDTDADSSPRPDGEGEGEGEAEPDDPYRDPERLAAVYEEYETFREMRDALGVDMTPQTVRRHMIDHGIHEVSPNPSVELQRRAAASEAATGSRSESESGSGSEPDPLDSRSGEEDRPESPPIEGDGGTPVPEGLDLPSGATIATVKDAVRTSRTVREVQHRLGIDEAETRAILREFDLLDLVIGRINADGRSDPTEAELDERIRRAGFGGE